MSSKCNEKKATTRNPTMMRTWQKKTKQHSGTDVIIPLAHLARQGNKQKKKHFHQRMQFVPGKLFCISVELLAVTQNQSPTDAGVLFQSCCAKWSLGCQSAAVRSMDKTSLSEIIQIKVSTIYRHHTTQVAGSCKGIPYMFSLDTRRWARVAYDIESKFPYSQEPLDRQLRLQDEIRTAKKRHIFSTSFAPYGIA